MFEEDVICPNCNTEELIEWPKDEDFECSGCGLGGYWSHYTDEEGQPLHWFFEGEEDD